MTLDTDAIRALVEGEHGDPFAVLGPHHVQTPRGAAVVVRAMMPGAAAVRVLPAGESRATKITANLDYFRSIQYVSEAV